MPDQLIYFDKLTRQRLFENLYDVAFKLPRSGRLHWIRVRASSPIEASRAATKLLEEKCCDYKRYREYGISRTTRMEYGSFYFSLRGPGEAWYGTEDRMGNPLEDNLYADSRKGS